MTSPAPDLNVAGEDNFLVLHGLQSHYIHWGNEGADPVVLIHGLMNNARYWEHIARSFLPDWSVFAPDMRGHGQTEHAAGGYLVWAFARDLQAFVEEVDLEAFDLVAHSIGSRAAMAYARDHSHRLKHLVLADMGPEMARGGAQGIRKNMGNEVRERPRFESEAAALEHFARQYPGQDETFLRRQLNDSLKLDEETGFLVFRYDPALHEATGRGAIVEIPFLWESLEHITCPTLVIRAEKSKVLSRDIADEMVARLPNGQFVEIPDSGHQVPLHKPEAFRTAVQDFLRT